MEELSNKVAIITGSSSGIGQATAVMFARKGAKVTLCGRDEDRLKKVLDQCIEASGGHQERFIAVRGDVTVASVRQEIVDKTIQAFERLDVLVANAGVTMPGSDIKAATEEVFDTIFGVNVKSVFFLIQIALPSLEKSKGSIVSVSSTASQIVLKGWPIYNMTKATIDHMTRCLALDLGRTGIRVNAVNPSYVSTINGLRYLSDNPAELDRLVRASERTKQPMGEIGTLEDVAEGICFLASDAAKFITGQCLPVDGGRILAGCTE